MVIELCGECWIELLLPTRSRTYNQDSRDSTVGVLSVAVNAMTAESLLSCNREWFCIGSDKHAPLASLIAHSQHNFCSRP
jgi:hypothetical protein